MSAASDHPQAKISVIILNWNSFKLTADAVDSVLANTPDEVEILLVDNGSDELVLRLLHDRYSAKPVQILEVGTNRFFGEGNNIGAEAASGEVLVFLNNDVLVTPGWLEPLVAELEQNSHVGAVGPKLVYPDGRLLEAGGFLNKYAYSVQRGKGSSAHAPQYSSRKEVQYVSAACIAIRKRDFVRLGGFSFVYEPAYYEDTDLCFSIRASGMTVVYQPRSVVIHKESQTTSSAHNSWLIDGRVEINRQKFLNRWGGGRMPPHVSRKNEFTTVESHSSSRVAVVFSPYELNYGGGEKYLLSVVRAFTEAGYRTILAGNQRYSRLRINALAQDFGFELSSVEFKLVSEIDFPIDVFITIGNEAYPPTRPIGKFNIHHCQFPFPNESETTEQIDRLRLVDVVVVNSEFTRLNYLEAAKRLGFTELRVLVISPPVSDMANPAAIRVPKQIVTVGRFVDGGHPKNQDKLIRGFSTLLNQHPDANLVLIGGLPSKQIDREFLDFCRKSAEGLPVSFHIDADPDNLIDLVQSSSVYWHGAGFGVDTTKSPQMCEHFGISLVEAMGAGVIPVVVGNGGPDEIVEFGVDGFKYQSLYGLVRRTEIIFDLVPKSQNAMRLNSRKKFEKYFNSGFDLAWTSLVGTQISKK